MSKKITRREFIEKSAAATAAIGFGLGASPRSWASVRTGARTDDTFKIGCIGTGAQGQVLLGALMRIAEAEVTAICDVYEPHLNQATQITAETAAPVTDYRRIIDDKDIQAVVIATPLHLHAPMAIEAMKAGKHVFVEKTMAKTVEAAKDICKTARATKRIVQVGHQLRTSPHYKHVLDLIEQGAIGDLTHIRAQWNRNGSWRRNVPKEFERLLNWRLYKEYSAGLMAELGSHQLQVVNWFLGSTPISVTGVGGIDHYKDGREVYDNVQVIYEYPKGVKVTYQSLTTNQLDGVTEQFMGTEGTLITGDRNFLYREPVAENLPWMKKAHTEKVQGKDAVVLNASATKKKTGVKEGETAIEASDETKDDYLTELEAFLHSIKTNTPPVCNQEEGLKVAITVLKANEAMEKGAKIKFKPEWFTY